MCQMSCLRRLGRVPHFLDSIDEFYSTHYFILTYGDDMLYCKGKPKRDGKRFDRLRLSANRFGDNETIVCYRINGFLIFCYQQKTGLFFNEPLSIDKKGERHSKPESRHIDSGQAAGKLHFFYKL